MRAVRNFFLIFLMFSFMCQNSLFANNASFQYKKEIAHYKKTKAAVTKVITLLKKRERAYKALIRSLLRLHKTLLKKITV